MIVQGLDQAVQRITQESSNRKRYNQLRNDVGNNYMDHCAKQSGSSSARLAASFNRQRFKGSKEWILEAKGTDAIEAGTKVPNARQLGAIRYMERALQQTTMKLPDLMQDFFQATGKAAGFHVSG